MKIMPRTTSTLPDDLHQLIEGSVDAGIFENKSDAIRHALRDYFVQELKHIGVLDGETRSHSGAISEYDPDAKPWILRSE